MSHKLNRFVDLSEGEKNHLICSICHNIFDNAINTECGHTFCKKCVQMCIQSNHKECPQCRKQLRKKRSNRIANDNNCVIISNIVFTRNLIVNAMVNELKIKCNFDFNGCQQTVRFGSLSSHLETCQHKICMTCGLSTRNMIEDHKCIEELKKERLQMKHRINGLEQEVEKSGHKSIKIEEEVKKYMKKIKELETKYNESLQRVKELENNNSKVRRLVVSLIRCLTIPDPTFPNKC